MRLSVIIPTLNAEHLIGKLLSSLKRQSSGPLELIVIDSSSDDDTVAVAAGFGARTLTVKRESFSHGGTRNMAAEEAKGDTLVFMTQDAMPADESLLVRLASPMSDPSVAAAFARQIPYSGASLPEKFARSFNYPATSSIKGMEDVAAYGIKTFFFSNVCSAIKKNIFFKVGMFPTTVKLNEDMLISGRLMLAGYKVAYAADAVVYHSHHLSLYRQFRRYYDIGASIRHSPWLSSHTRAEGEGRRFLKEQIRFMAERGAYKLLPYVFLDSLIKYIGFQAGLRTGR
jgi:rhamnosyltransferase